MTLEEYTTALNIIDPTNESFPHRLQPMLRIVEVDGYYESRLLPPADKEEWDNYQWNPPKYALREDAEFDNRPEVIAKPSWDELQAALRKAKRQAKSFDETQHIRRLKTALEFEVERRISANYNAKDFNSEMRKRLRGDSTPAQDAERDRLRKKYHSLLDKLAGMSYEQLKSFDITDDDLWINN